MKRSVWSGYYIDLTPEEAVGAEFREFAKKPGKEFSQGHLLPFARGKVDFLQVFRETKAIGYDGLYNYEIPGERPWKFAAANRNTCKKSPNIWIGIPILSHRKNKTAKGSGTSVPLP